MKSNKYWLFIAILFFFVACNQSTVYVKLENNTKESLSNIKITTISRNAAKHEKSKFDYIQVDLLEPGQISEMQLVLFLNFDCLSLQSDTKKLSLIDCMSKGKVKSGKYKISIEDSSFTWTEEN